MNAQLDDAILKVRSGLVATLNDVRSGEVLCEVVRDHSAASDLARVAWLLNQLGGPQPSRGFRTVAPDSAKQALAAMLEGYSFSVASSAEAAALTETLFASFAPHLRCYSTLQFHENGSFSGWDLTGTTIDVGFMVVTDESVAIFWVSDED